MNYITLTELKDYLEIDGAFRDGKLQPIVSAVNNDVAEYTGGISLDSTLKLKSLRYAEYLYLKSPGVRSEKEADESRKYEDKELNVSDFIPDRYVAKEEEVSDNMEIDLI